MKKKEKEFLQRLIETFKIEAAEHISEISKGVLSLEKETDYKMRISIIENVFREFHSLKGAARTVNLNDMGNICQSMEDIFSALKRGDTNLPDSAFDTMNETVDVLASLLETMGEGPLPVSGGTPLSGLITKIRAVSDSANGLHTETKKETAKTKAVQKRQKTFRRHETGAQKPKVTAKAGDVFGIPAEDIAAPVKETAASETVRVATGKLERLLIQAEEMLQIKLRAQQHASFAHESLALVEQWKKEWLKIYSGIRKLENSLQDGHEHPGQSQKEKLLQFLGWNRDHMHEIENGLKNLARSATEDYRAFSVMIDGLLDDSKKALMLPFSTLLDICPKVVRDLSHSSGKDADIEISGEDIEIEKRMLDELKDPLIHLLRNAIDHGIESREERTATGKPIRGKVSVTVSQAGGSKIKLRVSDDGRGIDRKKVAETAVKKGVVSREEAEQLTENESLRLIFQSGISTSEFITDLSGRGLGLPIVQEKAERLGGRVALETEPGSGTTFEILLPITRATSRVILIRTAGRIFAVPTTSVDRVLRVKEGQIKSVGKRPFIPSDDGNISYIRLDEILELQGTERSMVADGFITVLIVAASNTKLALGIDEIVMEQEALIKNLGTQLLRVRNIAGATILGTGRIVPVLNTGDLVKSAFSASVQAAAQRRISQIQKQRPKSVLVVEDSITTRTLMKNILESSGYTVTTAVDGMAAHTLIKSGGEFDIVVSDVDMPRMNGFDLARKIRSEKETEDLPVVLVTGLESNEDRERGIDAGANAYLVKQSFDQSNLLDTIGRLV